MAGIDPAIEEKKAWVVGSFCQALLTGVMAQRLIDPQHALSGRDLAEGLWVITAGVGSMSVASERAPGLP
ncbi:hypothetical protein AB0M44_31705 [Streptosporangium subroseum]|uniref:hypothetical protein n=1 Tax=Streptosporangium subroseum TaxID=106412 RepID=UPI00341BE396